MSDYNVGTALRQLDGLARLLHEQDDERDEEPLPIVCECDSLDEVADAFFARLVAPKEQTNE